MRILIALALALALCLSVTAQQASFTPFGSPCPNTSSPLAVTGLPKLNSTFTVSRIAYPGGCTRRFCLCSCCDCNTCSGAILFFGVQRQSIPLPGGCSLLISPDVLAVGDRQGNVNVTLPNSVTLLGSNFFMQRVDVRLQEVAGTACATTYRLTGIGGTSEALHGVIGM